MQQKDLLLQWRTVLKNVMIGPEIQKESLAQTKTEALKLLTQLGLQRFVNSYPMQLSGGMRQRVALVRTLLFRKEILLLDEPFGALDAMTRTVMQSILLDIWRKGGQTVLLITHRCQFKVISSCGSESTPNALLALIWILLFIVKPIINRTLL